jgi:adenylate kinase family enzyme
MTYGGGGRRVLVTGLPGVGKTTFATAYAAGRGLPHLEVDRLYYGPGWSVRASFHDDLERALAEECWCADDVGYEASRDLTWDRADTLIWLDLPWWIAEQRAVRRTLRRLRRSEVVYPGCKESWLGWGRPAHPVRYAWSRHGAVRRLMEQRLADPRWQHLDVVRLRTRAEVAGWLARRVQPS